MGGIKLQNKDAGTKNKKMKKKESDTFRLVQLDFDHDTVKEAIDEGRRNAGKDHFKWLMGLLLFPEEDGAILQQLREFGADGGLALQNPLEVMMLKKLNLPVLNFAQYLVEPLQTVFNK